MSASRVVMARRHRKHANPFSVRGELLAPDWLQIFGRSAPFALDVGFGEGMFLLELASRHPEWNVIGLEIRPHLVEGVQAQARARGLSNVHTILANVNVHLDTLVPDASVAFVAVNFPDPWFKQRHKKRRVVTPELMATLAKKLRPGGELHSASDYEPIARAIHKVIEAAPAFENLDGRGAFAAENTTGILTEREIKHQGRGEAIHRMRFRYAP